METMHDLSQKKEWAMLMIAERKAAQKTPEENIVNFDEST
jgi:hypothetical protein